MLSSFVFILNPNERNERMKFERINFFQSFSVLKLIKIMKFSINDLMYIKKFYFIFKDKYILLLIKIFFKF